MIKSHVRNWTVLLALAAVVADCMFPPHAKMSNVTEFHSVAAQSLNEALVNIATKGVDVNTALRQTAEKTNKTIADTLQSRK